jgi:NAD-dependent SIR2 family protein deacetylase
MTTCPRCEQDYLERYIDSASRSVFITCPECDATWPEGVRPSVTNFEELESFLGANGLSWEQAQALGQF